MMSLFSSFDLFYFFKNLISMFFIVSSFFLNSYYVSSFMSLMKFFFNNMMSFFYSLKMKSFNKFSVLLFLGFMFLLVFLNFFSVFSFNFPVSSQVSAMFFFSLSAWLSMIFFNVFNSTKKFLYHFVPEGTPMILTFLLFLIELVSNIIRPITLMVRLVANILAGHLLMILLSSLVFIYFYAFPFYLVLNLVEIFVSLVQSYIFATMLVLYFSEV